MSKISKFIQAVKAITRNPALLNKVLDDQDLNMQEVVNRYKLPKGLKTVKITDLLPGLQQKVTPYCAQEGGSTPIDLALLKGLASRNPGCKYFEIGTWRGESVANVASVASECVTLNLSDEAMTAMKLDPAYIALHRHYSNNLNNVTHLQGNSLTFDYTRFRGAFDLIFIDGDHHYESVKSDTANAFSLLKNDSSIIVWHDYGNDPTNVRWDVLRGILDGTPPEKRKYLYRVSNTLCAIYTEEPITAGFPTPFSIPSHFFSFHIEAHN